jgi:murein DD-endopeptidase MepM/ murein hydrolase activator NlpD
MATSPLSFSNNEEAQKYLDVQDELMRALENRAQPNLFQVAGALSKPTRTGNALEALGEGASEYGRQVAEKEKLEPSLIQMRAGLASQQYQIKQEINDKNLLQNYLQKKNPNLLNSVQESLTNGQPVGTNDMKDLNALIPMLKPGTQTYTQVKDLFNQAKEISDIDIKSKASNIQERQAFISQYGPLTLVNAQEYVNKGYVTPEFVNQYFGKEVIKPPKETTTQTSETKSTTSSQPMTITSGFGERINPITKKPEFHTGIDISGKEGTPIVPIDSGKVIKVEKNTTGFGNRVMVQHPDGTTSYYAHMQDINVKEGDSVTPNTPIGTLGRTGMSTGPHTEVGIIKDGKPIDPMPFIKGKSIFAQPPKKETLVASTDKYAGVSSSQEPEGFTFREMEGTEDKNKYREEKDKARASYIQNQNAIKLENIKSENKINEKLNEESRKPNAEIVAQINTSGVYGFVSFNNSKLNNLFDKTSTYPEVLDLMMKWGVLQPVAQAVASGFQTPLGSINADVNAIVIAHLPTKATAIDKETGKKYTYNPQAEAREIAQIIYDLNSEVMRAGKAIYGPNISNSDIVNMAKTGFSPADPSAFIINYAQKMMVTNIWNGKMRDELVKWRKENKNEPDAHFLDSEQYRNVVDNFNQAYGALTKKQK